MVKYCGILILCLTACGQVDNDNQSNTYGGTDYVFFSHYQNCLIIVGEYQMGNERVSSKDFLVALTCLEVITGIKDNVYRGDSMGYASRDDYYKDLNAWSHWYSQNRQTSSFDDVYKKFEAYRKANAEELTWPPMLVDLMITH